MGCEELLKWTQLYPGCLLLVGRLTAKSLRETTQKRWFEVLPRPLLEDFNKNEGKCWVKTQSWVTNEWGKNERVFSEILFSHMEDPGQFGSLDISGFYIDEVAEPDGSGTVPKEVFDMLVARLRYPVPPHRGFVTSNPGGYDWVWDYFFNPAKRHIYTDYWGMQVPTSANAKYLPKNYVEDLRRTHSDVWVKRFLEASFDSFDGQIWAEFDEKLHTFDPYEVDISPHWTFISGFDFGITAPTAACFAAVDKEGSIWVYDELNKANAEVTEFASWIKEKGFEDVPADPAVTAKGLNKKSPQDMYLDEGVNLIPSPNSEDYFMALFRKLLKTIQPDGKAQIRISTSCKHLIEEIKAERWDKRTIEGTTHDKVKAGIPNHTRDAFKYMLNYYGQHPHQLKADKYKIERMLPRKLEVNGQWEHESFLEDTDIDSENYPHPEIIIARGNRW